MGSRPRKTTTTRRREKREERRAKSEERRERREERREKKEERRDPKRGRQRSPNEAATGGPTLLFRHAARRWDLFWYLLRPHLGSSASLFGGIFSLVSSLFSLLSSLFSSLCVLLSALSHRGGYGTPQKCSESSLRHCRWRLLNFITSLRWPRDTGEMQ